MARRTDILTLSVPSALRRRLETLARREEKTTSELAREAFRTYLWLRRLSEIQTVGETIALKLGIETEDDIERRGR